MGELRGTSPLDLLCVLPTLQVSDVMEALSLCVAGGMRAVLDLDATLVPTGTTSEAYLPPPGVLTAALCVDAVIVTNRRDVPAELWGIPVVAHAGKPWTPRSRLPLSPRPSTVIGDQLLTDGLLARRLGATFIRVLPLGEHPRPWRTRLSDGLLNPLFPTKEHDGRS